MQKLSKLNPVKNLHTYFILLAAAFSFSTVRGQESLVDDTLLIREVIITRKQISSEQPGFKFYTIDTGRMNNYPNLFLNDLLRDATPLFIKEYGAGLTATSSFRGTSAGHTQVLWNGININDPMLGQTDFSLIPSGMIDNVMISFGGASMDLGNGAIGGIINLGNEPSWRKETIIDVAPGAGSFGRYSGLARISTGNEHFQSVTRAFLNSADYNFRYLDSEALPVPVWKTREHNGMSRKSLMQEFYFRKSANVLSARVWYKKASRELPGSTLYGYYGEQQSDESFRSLINYDAIAGKMEFFSSVAWLHSNMVYRSMFDTIGTGNYVNTFIGKDGFNLKLGDYTNLKVVINDEVNIIRSDNYQDNVVHNTSSLTVSAERKKGKWFGAALLVRETLDDAELLAPDFSAGFEFRTLRGEDHYIKINLSRNSKIPSMNDRYWNPGGNHDLKNEYAYSAEAGYSLQHQLGSAMKIASEITWFNSYITNMIQWYPDSAFNWVTGNIGSVNTSGFESTASIKYISSNISINLNAGYTYTRARDISSALTSGNQLNYIPKHQANGSVQATYRNFYSIWVSNFTGRVFTASDNSSFLKDYTISSLTCGYKLNIMSNSADLRLRIENIFNSSFRTIAYYPQPGRSFFLVLSLRFKA